MALNKINIAVLISGRGSNLQALVNACSDPDFPARIAVVLSNIAGAGGLQKAKDAGIPVEILSHSKKNRTTFDAELSAILRPYDIDLICLAGFMRILGADFVGEWKDRILNIHPSLLPDYKGTNTHARILQDGKTESGCTVHSVTTELDDGPTIVQKRVPVLAGDSPETLAARILDQEHVAYPQAVRLVAEKLLARKSF
ncbi:MAG: phosphoribosylglycinamide formyltransferase [Alphaproteobacteria bacterium]